MEHSSVDNGVCQCKPEFRSACYGAAKYEHGDERYCILHLPSEDKEVDFKEALEHKLDRKDSEDFDFRGTFFPVGASEFRGFEFDADVFFAGATFCGEADFEQAQFSGSKGTSFVGAQFSGDMTSFSEAEFSSSRGTFFSEAKFNEKADYSEATFSEEAYFDKAIFSGEVDFTRATFRNFADFLEATFGEGTYFFDATFRQMANFTRATFRERVHFSRLKTCDETTLGLRNITTEKPEQISFHTRCLRPSWFVDADAQGFDFSEVEWFRLPGGDSLTLEAEIEALKRRDIQPPESLGKLAKACRRLMSNAEENRDYPTASEFHYWSMEAQRKEGWSRLGLIATLYWALSGYGERPRRAFWVLAAIWLAFAALYLLLADTAPFWVFLASDVWQGIDYARQAVVYSLSALARLNPEPKPEELGWFQTLVTVEGILGPLQVALFLLAVRRKVMR